MDHAGFDALVRAYGADLYRYALWLCKDPTMAEDLVQETCLRAWRARHGLKNENAARGWVVTILRREFLRRAGAATPGPLLEEPAARTSEPSEVLAMREALGQLAPKYREPLVLQVVWGFSAKEIAEILELTPQGVMTRTFRARKQLREILEQSVGRRA